ncbi:MAG TPA: fibronectin type III domain-containing protein [Oligoflexia bacterium]|nr:fibronectin type III domain-containing protein [Oligoflexia bacterium]HMP48866.1 fibronectin type III domain-containing protein [Oligoflexia bacterium]
MIYKSSFKNLSDERSLIIYILFFISVVSLLNFSASGCGRKSGLKPPEESAPGPVVFPRMEPHSSSIVLKWSPPGETAGGDEIIGPVSYNILRRLVGKDSYRSFEEVAVIEPNPEESKGSGLTLEYEDTEIVPGGQYEYLIVPRDSYGYEGIPAVRLRVTFIGPASIIETLPFLEPDED